MTPDDTQSVVVRLLKEQLNKDAPQRERAIATFIAAASAVCIPIVLLLGPVIGQGLSFSLVAFLGFLTAYYGGLLLWLRRGRFHPALAWINVALEVSVPAVFFLFDAHYRGAEYALTAPPLAVWGGLIALSALRSDPRLSLAAGALAAAEYAGVCAVALWGRPAPEWVTLGPSFLALRALMLAFCGVFTAIVASHLRRKAIEAFQSIRERDLFGKYLLQERIGSGGMAEVYRALYCPEGGFEKVVAVKRILPAYAEEREFLALFQREAAIGSRLNHPNIVQVLDLGRHEKQYYLAMEYVDGATLKHLLRYTVELPLAAVCYLGAELASALDYLHQQIGASGEPLGLVHRDLNPPNILISRFGDVKLTDFGIARAADQASPVLTQGVRGKLGYMAPEQVIGEPLDGRTDLFALGLTLHEALTGERVLRGKTDQELMEAAVKHPLLAPSAKRPDVPPELDRIIAHLLTRDRARRTATGAELRQALTALTGPAAPFPQGRTLLAAAVMKLQKPAPYDEKASGVSQLNRPPLEAEEPTTQKL